MGSKLLLLSNGHGEDAMGALLAKRLLAAGLKTVAFPLVGEGAAYDRAGVETTGTQRTMPSGGFVLEAPANLWRDLRAGLLGLTLRQIKDLRRLRSEFDWAIALGDAYPLALSAFVLALPTVFIPTAKSEYIRGHFGWEYALMRRFAKKVFPRDAKTQAAMTARGVDARFVGNLMMDALVVTGERFGFAPERRVVALLPGSRQDAYDNAGSLFAVVEALGGLRPELGFLLALADGIDGERMAQATGWRFEKGSDAISGGLVGRFAKGEIRVACVRGHFGDALNAATVVIGLSGTGNEQAAGMGKPVVAFVGQGVQYTRGFAEDQQRLLGDALALTDSDPRAVAKKTLAILDDHDLYEKMARCGRERMGKPGGADRAATEIARLVRR